MVKMQDSTIKDPERRSTPRISANSEHKRALAVAALVGGASDTDAAKTAGVARNTLIRWRRTPEFQEALNEGNANIIQVITERLEGAATGAVDRLVTEVSNTKDGTPATRIRASVAVLDVMVRLREHVLYEERIAALEKALTQLDADK